MATYPSTLPYPETDYTLEPVDTIVRTDMESGATRSRRRTKARNDHVNVSWNLSDAQLKTFRDWYDDDTTGINGGASWFTIDLLIGNTGFDTVTAKFASIYTVKYTQVMRWVVSAKLEIR